MTSRVSVSNTIHPIGGAYQFSAAGKEKDDSGIFYNNVYSMNESRLITHEIEALAKSQPKKLAIDYDLISLCYKDYFEAAAALANYLKALELGTEDNIVVFLDVSHHIPIALLSILMIGSVYVPIDVTWPKSRIGAILKDVSPKAILTQSVHYHKFSSVNYSNVIVLDDKIYEGASDFSCALTSPSQTNTAVIFYTSGSTGLPKGVQLSYGNIQSFIEGASKTYRFSQSDNHLSIAKYSFSISLFDLLLPFYCGGSLLLKPRQQLLNIDALANFVTGVTCFHMGPALLDSLVNYAENKGLIFSNISHVSSGGDMIPAALLERCKVVFPNSEIWVIYGCTEIACMGATWQVDRTVPTNTTLVGKAFSHAKLLLLDDNLSPVDVGEHGEIYFSGAGVTPGYLNRDELNQTTFKIIAGDRFYATGDFGLLTEKGDLQLKGRKDFQIKINGIRIETEEIEYWLNQIESVTKCIVIGARDVRSDLKVVAFICNAFNDTSFNETSIKQLLAAELPDYMVPKRIFITPELPLNTNGKIDRNALVIKAEKALKENISEISSDDDVAKQLMKIWFNAGASGTIYDDSNFFDVGGDSLGAVQLVHAINAKFKIHCDFELIYAYPVFSAQLKAISNGFFDSNVVPDSLVVPLDEKSNSATNTIYMIPGMDGHIVSYHNFGNLLSGDWCAFGLLYPNFNGETYNTIEDVAFRLVEDILKVQKQGPYFVAGHSSGGIVGLEIARILEEMEKEVYLVLIEARIYDVSPRKPIRELFFIYLKNKPRLITEQFLLRQKNKFFSRSKSSSVRYKQRQALTLSNLKGAFNLKKSMLVKYNISPVNVKALLIKARESIWWDDTRDWPVDYGFSKIVKTLTIANSSGNHVSIVMDSGNHRSLAKIIESEMTKVMLKRIV